MFGYVVVNKEELKLKDFEIYRSFYCGLCRTLRDSFGRSAQVSLNFDMSFLAILLSGLYEPETKEEIIRCGIHPVHKKRIYENPYISYAADMTIVLTYLKCEDNWNDEHSHISHMYQKVLKNRFEEMKARYPKKIAIIQQALAESAMCEKEGITDLDRLSSLTGTFMAEILCYQEDEWSSSLREMGDYLGRFIYILDAYDDLKEDKKKQLFNPLFEEEHKAGFDERIKDILELMIAQSSEAFERMPIIEYSDILRNIIYSGIWSKYMIVKKKRAGEDNG